ncbi:protease Do-like 7 [Phtheirospermum japonicum]|uniref:Protease Do-like 7 n=1 Tax=Phtheirospermum japonicum TaxID=374723 RepID=A0A830BHZ2_9LAMI|nr:protease Do-like 7 [Phtheirospermum japonicum]
MERLGSETAMEGMETSMKENLSMEIDPPLKENLATAEDWQKALDKVVPAVVVLRTTACRAFDTESAGASYATGFIVDKSRGVILTNRHVVKAGPVVEEAMFVNREEVPVYEAPSIKGNVVKQDLAGHADELIKNCSLHSSLLARPPTPYNTDEFVIPSLGIEDSDHNETDYPKLKDSKLSTVQAGKEENIYLWPHGAPSPLLISKRQTKINLSRLQNVLERLGGAGLEQAGCTIGHVAQGKPTVVKAISGVQLIRVKSRGIAIGVDKSIVQASTINDDRQRWHSTLEQPYSDDDIDDDFLENYFCTSGCQSTEFPSIDCQAATGSGFSFFAPECLSIIVSCSRYVPLYVFTCPFHSDSIGMP